MTHRVNFWFDPLCPWCYVTSMWMREVGLHRDLTVSWHSFSLAVKNDADADSFSWETLRLLRVIESVRAEHGDEPVGALYADMGAHIHHDGSRDLAWLPARLEAHGLADHAAALDDEAWDDVIRTSMKAGLELAGDDVGTPLVQFADAGETAFFGPVMTKAPRGRDAVKLFDGLMDVFEVGGEGFYELKRTRNEGPQFGERPQLP